MLAYGAEELGELAVQMRVVKMTSSPYHLITSSLSSQPLLQTCFQEFIEIAVEYSDGVADLDVRAQILTA